MHIDHCDFPLNAPLKPCFSGTHTKRSGWIHVPVSLACNIECRSCSRKLDDVQGLALRAVMGIGEAVARVESRLAAGDNPVGVAISGPGEPLANAATSSVLQQFIRNFPGLALGIATNGLLLRDRIERIVADGIRFVSITINAFTPETAKRIYSRILYKGRRYSITDSAEFLLRIQWQGLMLALDAGICVSVNTVLMPGVNEHEVAEIARKAGELGAKHMQIIPYRPASGSQEMPEPDLQVLSSLRDRCGEFILQAQE